MCIYIYIYIYMYVVVYRSGWKWAIATLCPISSHFCEGLLTPFRG